MSLESIKEAREKINKLQVELSEQVKLGFHEEAQKLFDQFPGLIGFRWTQYTPYFNDGDPCRFRASTDYPEIAFDEIADEDDPDEKYVEHYAPKESKEPSDVAARGVKEFLCVFDDHDYEEMFGDGVQVTVTAEGIETDDYDHD